MAKIIPYLRFESTYDAIEYYKQIFGENILVERVSVNEEMAKGMGITGDLSKTTMHSIISLGGNLLMASDNMKNEELHGQMILLDFDMEKEEEVKKIKEIAEKFEKVEATVLMPLKEQFWGGMMGHYQDKYGNIWLLHAQKFSEQVAKGGILKSYYTK